MAGNKYVGINGSGDLAEVVSVNSSGGAGDANKIVALDAAGKINSTMLPETGEYTMTTSEALTAGDLVNIHDSTGAKIRKADATNGRIAHGFVENNIGNGASGTVVIGDGMLNALTGLTIGAQYFLGAAGAITDTPTTTAGQTLQKVGYAKSATEFAVVLGDPITRA